MGLRYEKEGWQSSVESDLMRVTQSGGLVYGLPQGGPLNIDLGVKGFAGAFGGASADTMNPGINVAEWRRRQRRTTTSIPPEPGAPFWAVKAVMTY